MFALLGFSLSYVLQVYSCPSWDIWKQWNYFRKMRDFQRDKSLNFKTWTILHIVPFLKNFNRRIEILSADKVPHAAMRRAAFFSRLPIRPCIPDIFLDSIFAASYEAFVYTRTRPRTRAGRACTFVRGPRLCRFFSGNRTCLPRGHRRADCSISTGDSHSASVLLTYVTL